MFNEDFPIPAIALIIAGIILGLILIKFGIRNFILSQQSKSWPSVKGVIVSSSMLIDQDETDFEIYKVHVSYEYFEVAKQYYSRNEYLMSKIEAETHVKKYPEGMEFDIYYQPDNPQVYSAPINSDN